MSDLFVETFSDGASEVVVAADPYFGSKGSAYFHDQHAGKRADLTWPTRDAAIRAGRTPCGVCRP